MNPPSPFTVRLASVAVTIHPYTPTLATFLADYRTQTTSPDCTVFLTPQDIQQERYYSAQEDEREGHPIRTFPDSYLETLALLRKLAQIFPYHNTVLFHGSAIAIDGQGYLFTAPSGTGKSTHVRLWRQQFGNRAVMVNDDKPFLRLTSDQVLVCGSPWDGKHRLSTNCAVPLRGLCLLRRGEQNTIRPVSLPEAYPTLLQQCYRPGDVAGMTQTLDVLEQLGQRVPLYQLTCTMDPNAALVAYAGMGGTL